MKPPYTISETSIALLGDIQRILGRYEGLMMPTPTPKQRRQNRIRSIRGSVAIEGNTLSEEQISAILDGKPVVGPKREIVEVQNAIRAYADIHKYRIISIPSFCQAHKLLTHGLIADAGQFRSGGVGIMQGSKVAHVAPSPKRVPELMGHLFDYLKTELKSNALIASCVFHYETEFIHPFSDGNGRIGRLWQHAILTHYHGLFEYVPMESVIMARQKQYYAALSASDKASDSGAFIEFCLTALKDALEEFLAALKPEPLTAESRLEVFKSQFSGEWFSRKDYLVLFKTLSTATASRDLKLGADQKTLTKKGDKIGAVYRFRR